MKSYIFRKEFVTIFEKIRITNEPDCKLSSRREHTSYITLTRVFKLLKEINGLELCLSCAKNTSFSHYPQKNFD